jgi:HEAT repeat protein
MINYLNILIYFLSLSAILIFSILIIFHLKLKYKEVKVIRVKEKYSSIIDKYLQKNINLKKAASYFKDDIDYELLKSFFKPYLKEYEGIKFERLKQLIMEIGLNEYFSKKLNSNNRKEKLKAVSFLGKLEDKNTLVEIKKLLDSNDRLTITTAAWAISEMEETNLLQPVMKALFNKTNMTYEAITELLVNFGEDMCDDLIQYINLYFENNNFFIHKFEIEDFKVLSVFVDIFGFFRYEKSLPVLEKLLFKNENSEVRIHIFKTLVKIGKPTYVNLHKFLQSDNWVIRSQCARYIGIIKAKQYSSFLIKLLKDENWWVGYYAARSLWKMDKIDMMKEIIINNKPGTRMCKYIFAQHNFEYIQEGQ